METTTMEAGGAPRLTPEAFADRAAAIEREVGRVIVGQRELVRQTVTTLLANSHVLLEGVPGLGKTTQGNQQGPGTDPGSYVPYSQVYSQFYQYALTTLDRGYVPLSVKDYVRDYFSSLDPAQ